jgi:peptidoglycan-associated lipoprotein
MLRLSTFLKLFAIFGFIALAACSGKESETAVTPPPPPQQTQQEQPVVEDENMPEPGTAADLAYQAGSDRVFFAFDSIDLSPEARATLRKQADWLQKYSNITVTIEGHADERGTREYNLALGDRRATSVKNYLVALGISPSRISTVSYGKERPAVLGSNEEAWAQNRRAVTSID